VDVGGRSFVEIEELKIMDEQSRPPEQPSPGGSEQRQSRPEARPKASRAVELAETTVRKLLDGLRAAFPRLP
jgi:hypothetical protein